ncbi:MAG: rod-binding protein [Nitrospiraceae bacterium]
MDVNLPLNRIPPVDPTGQVEEMARSLTASAHSDRAGEIRAAAQAFEGYFLSYLLKVMRETIPTGLIENKAGQQFYSFYDQEIGRLAAQAGGIGLARMVEEDVTRLNSDRAEAASKGLGISDR